MALKSAMLPPHIGRDGAQCTAPPTAQHPRPSGSTNSPESQYQNPDTGTNSRYLPDSGKRAHHCFVIDLAGTVLLSKRVENDEIALLDLIATTAEIAAGGEVCWATDLNAGGAALLIELLAAHAQRLLYIPGRIVHHAAATYRGVGKTDAKAARIIADQARMRTDLQPVRGADRISVDLRLLTARRTDLVCDLLEYFPALEGAFDYSKKAPLIHTSCKRFFGFPCAGTRTQHTSTALPIFKAANLAIICSSSWDSASMAFIISPPNAPAPIA